MATITGFTAARMLEIENTTVVDGHIDGDDLILVQRDSTEIVAGNVRGPVGGQADVGDIKANIAETVPGWLNMNTPIANANVAHPALWAIIPTSWKSGTTLVFPNTEDCILQAGGTVGTITGANTKTLVENNLPPHVHAMAIHNHASGAHTHDMTHNHPAGTTTNVVDHAHSGRFSSGAALSAGGTWYAHRITDTAGTLSTTLTGNAGAHSHTFDVANYSGNTGGATASNTGNNAASNTGVGNGASTPVNVEQRALRINWFIFPG